MSDREIMEESLVALGDRYEGLAEELFATLIASRPQYAAAFINPEAARERMTGETLEAMVGLAASEWWVDGAVTSFVDLHRNYADFDAGDYEAWILMTIAAIERRAGSDWPAGASAAWARQADALNAIVARELAGHAARAARKRLAEPAGTTATD
ncbi:hypothetical protein ACFO0A_11910 [Novosphingobium tardum]|uniref:Globin n=1 Tax=Novosphingobium tardum TaxID=1538021 RepID=A0ABV8RSC2_9SPHN